MGGRLNKFILVRCPWLLTLLRIWDHESELLTGGETNAWAVQLWSQYAFDPAVRPLFNTSVTVGYCHGINKAHAKLRRLSAAGVAITREPFLVLTSKGDDVLDGDETALCAHAIGPSRTLVQLLYARHDVFLSADALVVRSALAHLDSWMMCHFGPPAHTSEGCGSASNVSSRRSLSPTATRAAESADKRWPRVHEQDGLGSGFEELVCTPTAGTATPVESVTPVPSSPINSQAS